MMLHTRTVRTISSHATIEGRALETPIIVETVAGTVNVPWKWNSTFLWLKYLASLSKKG